MSMRKQMRRTPKRCALSWRLSCDDHETMNDVRTRHGDSRYSRALDVLNDIHYSVHARHYETKHDICTSRSKQNARSLR